MSKYIKAESTSAWLDNIGYPKLSEVIMNDKRFPPEDVVEVVRCRNCHWWDGIEENGYSYCANLDMGTKGDFFCGSGERKKK